MRYLYGFIALLCCPFAFASEIPEVKIEPQDVMVWNNVDSDVLGTISADIDIWRKKKGMGSCQINYVSTFFKSR